MVVVRLKRISMSNSTKLPKLMLLALIVAKLSIFVWKVTEIAKSVIFENFGGSYLLNYWT